MTDDLRKARNPEDARHNPPGERRKIEVELANENIKELRQERKERKKYAARIFWMICTWLIVLMSLFVFQGFLGPWGWFSLSDAALIAIATTTTASVTGIFLLVVKHLFPAD